MGQLTIHINHKKPLKLSFRPLLGSHMLISAAHKFSVDMSESKTVVEKMHLLVWSMANTVKLISGGDIPDVVPSGFPQSFKTYSTQTQMFLPTCDYDCEGWFMNTCICIIAPPHVQL